MTDNCNLYGKCKAIRAGLRHWGQHLTPLSLLFFLFLSCLCSIYTQGRPIREELSELQVLPALLHRAVPAGWG